MHTSMSVSEKSDDMVGKQEKSLFSFKKINYRDESRWSNSIILSNPSALYWGRGTVKVA